MNFVTGKFGKSTLFNKKNWQGAGGDGEMPLLIEYVAKLNPEHTFYIIGRNDLSRLPEEEFNRINPHKNIIDVWQFASKEEKKSYSFPYEYLKDKNIDAGFFYTGMASYSNIPNSILDAKGKGIPIKSLFCFEAYAGPLVHYVNESKIPYFDIAVDPRYLPLKAKDRINQPKFVVSQYNIETICKHVTELATYNYTETKTNAFYTGIETVLCLGNSVPDFSKMEKTNKFLIVLNEGGNGGLLRGPILKQYVLDHVKDVEIYGKWSEEWLKDSRFKGSRQFVELEPMLEKTKYTFIIPIQEGWVTSKYMEMMRCGVIPFFHPYYDQQKNLKVPDFIRINKPQELFEKIEFLENNPDEYQKLLKEIEAIACKDEYYNGTFVNKIIMDSLYRVSKVTEKYILNESNLRFTESLPFEIKNLKPIKSNMVKPVLTGAKPTINIENSLEDFFD